MAQPTRTPRVKAPQRFRFSVRLEQVARGATYAVSVPAGITRALGKRGPVPVTAEINGTAQFIASLSPAGGGRHMLRLNAETREAARVELGDLVRVRLEAHERAPVVAIPADLQRELRSEGVLEGFQLLVMGKQRHIIDWIEQAARPETRVKRIRLAVEIAHRKAESQQRRAR